MQNTFEFTFSEITGAGVVRTASQRIEYAGASFVEAWSKVTRDGFYLIPGTSPEALPGGLWSAWVGLS